MNRKQVDDLFFAGLVGITVLGGLLAAFRAQVGDLAPIFIWSVNCGLIYLAGTIIEG
jgi:hypothetical protein